MKEQPRSEKDIFLSAIEKQTPEERAAYVERICRDAPHLRAGLEALLAAHDHLGNIPDIVSDTPIPDTSPGGTVAEEAVPERVGNYIGRYKLLQQVGEGGMGSVWMAEQTLPVQRKVALKV